MLTGEPCENSNIQKSFIKYIEIFNFAVYVLDVFPVPFNFNSSVKVITLLCFWFGNEQYVCYLCLYFTIFKLLVQFLECMSLAIFTVF